ncbi:MAG: hypothetical protein V7690_05230 [Shewanella sp.]|uniref:hypothetical protein n=1 Tax=Shewanella sp. TaxID=50422 RepID=UPI003003966F
MNKTKKSQLDDWLKGLGWLAIIGTIIAFCLIGFYTFFTRGTISNQQSDWAAFGSFLSGVFSFLGAIGTVGVMLLGIKQFKVQQDQIDAQTERQNNFEEKQEKKWAKENEMLNFQKYQMHISQFNNLINALEIERDANFLHKSSLYNFAFPDNNYSSTSFTKTSKYSLLYHLDEKITKILNITNEYSESPSAVIFHDFINIINEIFELMDVEFKYSYRNENGRVIFKRCINDIPYILDLAIELYLGLCLFTGFKSKLNFHSTSTLVILEDTLGFCNKSTYPNNGYVLELLVLIQAAIKNNPPSYPELYQLSQKELITPTPMNPTQQFSSIEELENIRGMIIESNLILDEQQIIIEKLDEYHNELLTKAMG